MMKNKLFPAVFILVFIALFVFGGMAFFNRSYAITVYDGEEMILNKTYEIDTRALLYVKLFCKGSFGRYYQKLLEKGEEIPLSKISAELNDDIYSLPKKSDKAPKNATAQYLGNGKFSYTKEEIGYRTDLQKTVENVFCAFDTGGRANLFKDVIEPEITETQMLSATRKIAEFSTSCAGSSAERKHNISLACSLIESSKVESGEEFSFNKTVGPRTTERGFRTAKIIVGGEFVEGVGGGVCQVSTTLYNAWCLAGLKVARCAPHSLPVHYVRPGLDAMVASSSDLVLLNDSEYPVYIDSYFGGDTVKFAIYGKPCGMNVKLRSEVLEILPCDDYAEEKVEITDWKENELFRIIKKPENGLISASYREFYDDNGTLLNRERLRKTVYLAQKGKIVYRNTANSAVKKIPETLTHFRG